MELENSGSQAYSTNFYQPQSFEQNNQGFSLFGGGMSQTNTNFSLFPQTSQNFSSNLFTPISQPTNTDSLFRTDLIQQRSLFDNSMPTLNFNQFGSQQSMGLQGNQPGAIQPLSTFPTQTNTFGLNLDPRSACPDDDPNDEDYKPPQVEESSSDEEEYMNPDEMQEGILLFASVKPDKIVFRGGFD